MINKTHLTTFSKDHLYKLWNVQNKCLLWASISWWWSEFCRLHDQWQIYGTLWSSTLSVCFVLSFPLSAMWSTLATQLWNHCFYLLSLIWLSVEVHKPQLCILRCLLQKNLTRVFTCYFRSTDISEMLNRSLFNAGSSHTHITPLHLCLRFVFGFNIWCQRLWMQCCLLLLCSAAAHNTDNTNIQSMLYTFCLILHPDADRKHGYSDWAPRWIELTPSWLRDYHPRYLRIRKASQLDTAFYFAYACLMNYTKICNLAAQCWICESRGVRADSAGNHKTVAGVNVEVLAQTKPGCCPFLCLLKSRRALVRVNVCLEEFQDLKNQNINSRCSDSMIMFTYRTILFKITFQSCSHDFSDIIKFTSFLL